MRETVIDSFPDPDDAWDIAHELASILRITGQTERYGMKVRHSSNAHLVVLVDREKPKNHMVPSKAAA